MKEIVDELMATLRAISRKGTHKTMAARTHDNTPIPPVIMKNEYAKIADTALARAEARMKELS